jgi:hypothetical protein
MCLFRGGRVCVVTWLVAAGRGSGGKAFGRGGMCSNGALSLLFFLVGARGEKKLCVCVCVVCVCCARVRCAACACVLCVWAFVCGVCACVCACGALCLRAVRACVSCVCRVVWRSSPLTCKLAELGEDVGSPNGT